MPELTIEEFKKQMQAREKITLTMLDNQTAEIMKDEALFKDLLDMLARHVTTSVSNTILVQAQLPDATAVTSIVEWEKRQVPVAKDENGYYPKGIYQITYDGQYTDDSGNVHAKYKIYKGYDAEQTVDPDRARAYMNEKPSVNVFYSEPDKVRNLALVNASPIKCITYNPDSFIADEEFISEAEGVKYIPETKTVILRKIDRSVWFQLVANQIALGMYHRIDGIKFSVKDRVFEAAIVSCMLSRKMGLSTEMYHFDLSELPQKYTPQQFRKMLEQAVEFSKELAFRVNQRIKQQNQPKSPKPVYEPQLGV